MTWQEILYNECTEEEIEEIIELFNNNNYENNQRI